jgi:excisionase family DNA binding protein
MDILAAGIAVAAFAAVVFVLTGAGRRLQRAPARIAPEPVGDDPVGDDEWLTVDEVAELLEVRRTEVVELVERDAIPYFVISGGNPAQPSHLRFRRDEIDAWTIG